MPATKKPKAKKANCECWKDVDAQLKEKGFRLDREIQMDFGARKASVVAPLIRVHKDGDGKARRLPTIVCGFCPFFGKKLNY